MQQVEVAVIGTGWCGGIRAETLSRSALVDKLHICEIRPDRLAEVKALTRPATATLDYQDIIKNPNISVVYISTTPEQNHYPITRDCLKAGKHVLLEKPIAMELWEADELITLARRGRLKFTIGYSQRFNTKFAYAKKKITDGTLGKVVSVMVSRHLSRGLGAKIAKRVKLSPVVMESTHDLDFVFWLLEPAKPVRVYSQGAYGYMQPINGSYDVMWSIVTMDNGMLVTVGGGWNLPPGYPNFCSTWVEITGTEGALILDDTHRDAWLNTVTDGTRFPMSTMPGEQVDHVFAGQMGPETIHFLEACIMDRPVMATPESARMVMETYTAADLSAERNEPVDLPLSNATLSVRRRCRAPRWWTSCTSRNPPGPAGRGEGAHQAGTATLDYQDILKNPNISLVYISTTPEQKYPITRDCLKAGKHVLLEKPIAMELWEADELITLARRGRLKFTIGYSQRFNTKFAYAKKKITDGTLGKVVSVMVSRHLSRGLGAKIAKRVKLSPVVMEFTHDLDFVFWLLEPAKPVRVYSQGAYGYMQPINGSYDVMWSIVTMDNGMLVTSAAAGTCRRATPISARPGWRSPAPRAP